MGLIKSNNAPASLSPFSMRDIENQARAIILRAQQQTEQLLAGAQAEAVQLKEAAHAKGAQEGFSEGLKNGTELGRKQGHQQALDEHRAKLTQLVESVTAMIQDIDSSRRQLHSEAVSDVVELAIAIGRRVTKRQGLVDPAVLQANLAEAMKLVVHASDVRIAIHPQQKQTLAEELPRLQLQWPNLTHIELIEDAELSPGGCRVMTREGQIDGDLESQLDRVVADLLPKAGAV
jgi:flagellar assembly protein FliH